MKCVQLCREIAEKHHEYDLTNQLKRSSTSISANLNEAAYAASRADFSNKLNIAMKEANESRYWLDLFHETKMMDDRQYEEIYPSIESIIRMLTASLVTLRGKNSE